MPALTQNTKERRLELRLTANQRHDLEEAAAIQGLSLSSYLLHSSLRQAQQDLSQQRTLALEPQEQQKVIRALAQPPAPNPRLRKAARAYQAHA